MLRSITTLAVRRSGGVVSSSTAQRAVAPSRLLVPAARPQQLATGSRNAARFLSSSSSSANSSSSSSSSSTQTPKYLKPPEKLTTEMAEGIAETTKFYVRHGLGHRRLKALAADDTTPVVEKWQQMMEIFLTTQVHVIAGMGYTPDEEGLNAYAQALAACIQESDETMQALFSELRRDTWREIVATAFDLNVDDIPVLSIVDARNIMHKVSSKMIEPSVLLEIQTKTAKLGTGDVDNAHDVEVELAQKHQVLQDIIVNHVYLSTTDSSSGKKKSLIEEAGFPAGPNGYAMLQCAMSDYEGDPLIAQYAASAMMKVWEAAGLDMSSLQQEEGAADTIADNPIAAAAAAPAAAAPKTSP